MREGRWVIREGNSLLVKVGVIMMTLALALVIAAVVVRVTLGSGPGRVAAEVAAKSSQKDPHRPTSGEVGSATKKSSSQKESTRYPSGEEESPGYGSPSSGGPARQRKEEAKEPKAVLQQVTEPQKSQSATPQPAGQQAPPEAPSEPELQPQQPQPKPEDQPLPAGESDWQRPTRQEVEAANEPRHYNLPAGAIMGLTIEAIGIYDAPVFDSDGRWALANGVAHNPQTSLPWSPTPQRNVYLAGHRMGYRGTWSRMIFYNLDKLERGDEVVLKDRAGRSYRYRVSEVFITDPRNVWVMGQVRGRDMVTLQTCTPIPTFQKRLIVRADRV
jgi:sortase A